jgi:pimeloyl-ACP methyl ester carboxylesterase
MKYLLDFRERDVSGAVVPGRLTDMTTGENGPVVLGNLVAETQVTFLIHGFNVSGLEGESALNNLAKGLPDVTGGLVGVLWPGDHGLGFLSYSFEGRDAEDTADELARFIDDNLQAGTPLSFAAHSLGARVAMETMKRLDDRYPLEQACYMAAAVDDDSVSEVEVYRAVVESTSRVAVLSSKEDEVLKYAYPVADLLQAFLFFSMDSFGLALGYHGPRPHSAGDAVPGNVVHTPIPVMRNSDHGDYLWESSPTPEHVSAAAYANGVLSGHPDPSYP